MYQLTLCDIPILVSSRRSQILYSGGDSTATKDGATVFEVSW